MKLFTLVLFTILTSLTTQAQNWIYLGNDVSGDTESAGPDIDSVFYAIDDVQDSIWFRVTTHDPLGADYAFYFFIDGDLNPTNGFTIPSVGFGGPPHPSPNLDMYLDDRFVVVSKSTGFSDAWTEYWTMSGGSQSTDAFFQETGTHALQVSAQLSDVDLHACEGDFNVVAVSGVSFFGQLSDFAPSSNYFTTYHCSANLEEEQFSFSVYPNPCHAELLIDMAGGAVELISFTNVLGQQFNLPYNMTATGIQVETNSLDQGQYIIHIETENGQHHDLSFVKM